jgi:hypothetical protein
VGDTALDADADVDAGVDVDVDGLVWNGGTDMTQAPLVCCERKNKSWISLLRARTLARCERARNQKWGPVCPLLDATFTLACV